MSNSESIQNFIQRLASRYQRNSVIRALVQLIPAGIGSAADVAIATRISNIREQRARAFFDELASQDIALTDKQIESDDFLHAYFSTTRAALNTRRQEKIRLFARLFGNYARRTSFVPTDAYEELLTVLDDLGYREFQVLLILRRFEASVSLSEEQNALQRVSTFWDAFIEAVEAETGVPRTETPGFLARLNRTGLYQTFVGTYVGYTGDKGCLTPNFATFLKALGIAGDDVNQ